MLFGLSSTSLAFDHTATDDERFALTLLLTCAIVCMGLRTLAALWVALCGGFDVVNHIFSGQP